MCEPRPWEPCELPVPAGLPVRTGTLVVVVVVACGMLVLGVVVVAFAGVVFAFVEDGWVSSGRLARGATAARWFDGDVATATTTTAPMATRHPDASPITTARWLRYQRERAHACVVFGGAVTPASLVASRT